jgi:uncharacterized membrane protein (DUF441 family)
VIAENKEPTVIMIMSATILIPIAQGSSFKKNVFALWRKDIAVLVELTVAKITKTFAEYINR